MAKVQARVEIGQYLVIDPEVCHGQLTFKGTRIPVDAALTYLWLGNSIDVLLHGWPELSRPALLEAIRLASEALQEKHDFPGKLPANYHEELEPTVAA